ncbi:MAG: D-2-hydroxyacid dehydrogenase [Clostridiales bacterium]|nr:D-2-hydroxyacid dehydrogenase [Clostridiales bacterium]
MIRNILVVMPAADSHRRQLEAAAPGAVFTYASSPAEEDVARADAIVGNIRPELLAHAKNLKLLQLNSAGSNPYLSLPAVCPGARLCCATGAYGLAISEHMMGVLLELMKKLALYRDNQFEGRWQDLGPVTSVYGANVLVVGMGDIGTSFARLCAAFGARVTGVRRRAGEKPDFVESIRTPADLDALLPEADVVFLSLPETPETIGLMSDQRIALMKETAYLLNCGRGSAVDQAALLRAVRAGKLAGAGLDVTTPEPLSQDHPLWREPRIVITPHVSGQYHLAETHNRIVALACRNLRALQSGGPLESEVSFSAGY